MNLELQILQIIDSAAPLLMPRATLVNSLRLSGRTETGTEITRALQALEAGGDLLSISNPDVPGGYRDRITDQGKARLAAAGL